MAFPIREKGSRRSMVAAASTRIEAADRARRAGGLGFRIEVDGGITAATAPLVTQRGADTLVAGSSTFQAPDMAAAIRALREGP